MYVKYCREQLILHSHPLSLTNLSSHISGWSYLWIGAFCSSLPSLSYLKFVIILSQYCRSLIHKPSCLTWCPPLKDPPPPKKKTIARLLSRLNNFATVNMMLLYSQEAAYMYTPPPSKLLVTANMISLYLLISVISTFLYHPVFV